MSDEIESVKEIRLVKIRSILEGYKSGKSYGEKLGLMNGKLEVVESILNYISTNNRTLESASLLKDVVEICWNYVEEFNKLNPLESNSEYDN